MPEHSITIRFNRTDYKTIWNEYSELAKRYHCYTPIRALEWWSVKDSNVIEHPTKSRIPSHLLSAILDHTQQIIMTCDNNGTLTFLNENASKLIQKLDDGISGEWINHCYSFVNNEVINATKDQIPLFQSLHSNLKVEKEIIFAKDWKNPQVYTCFSTPLYDDQEKKIGASMFLSEIDEDSAHMDKYFDHINQLEKLSMKNKISLLASEMALQRSESKFESVFQQSPFSIQIINRDGGITFANKAWQELWGINDKNLPMILQDYNIFNDQPLKSNGTIELIKKAFLGETVKIPLVYYDPAALSLPGRPRWVEAVVYPIEKNSSLPTEVAIIHMDITDKQELLNQKEKLLQNLIKEELRLSTIVEKMPAGLLVIDINTNEVILMNDNMHTLIGGPGDLPLSLVSNFIKLIRARTSNEMSYFREFDDNNITLRITSGVVDDPSEGIKTKIIICEDISEQEKNGRTKQFLNDVTDKLLSSLDFKDTITQVATNSIPYFADGCIVDLVEGGEIKRLLTKHHDPCTEHYLKELQAKFPITSDSRQPVAEVIKTGRTLFNSSVDMEYIKSRTSNEEHVSIIQKIGIRSYIAVPLQIRGKTIGALNFLITTKRKAYTESDLELAEELSKRASIAIDNASLYKDAQTSIKLRDDFISIASHELKNPVNSLALQLNVLGRTLSNSPRVAESLILSRILKNAKAQTLRLSRVVQDMFDISKISGGKLSCFPVPTDISKVLIDAYEQVREVALDSHISITLDTTPGLIINCDPLRIEQVFSNIFANAMRYGAKKPIHVSLKPMGDKIRISFRDHGHGIAKEDHHRIFQRFERAIQTLDGDGLGLGLYISKEIVDSHGGSIYVESEVGAGAEFIILLSK